MGILDKIRGLFAGPTHVDEGTPTAGDAEFEHVAETSPTYGSLEGSEAAEGELESEAAPPDPAP